MKHLLTAALLLCTVFTNAQKAKIGDYIENFTSNEPTGMKARTVQYVPDNGDFLCINGKNRFTRALYGNHTEYRVETSDKPVFALFKAKNYRSLRFYLDGVQLDSVDYCEARYGKGRRSYVLRDKRWGESARVTMEVVARHDDEGCYFMLRTEGFGKPAALTYRMCRTAISKLSRNGDIGADKAGCFEPSPTEEGLVTETIQLKETAFAYTIPHTDREVGHTMTLFDGATKQGKEIAKSFEASRSHFETLAERVRFTTPDPMLNTLGSTLVLAADGAWDGETWLHGAIGWRMPLAGWRAGYLGDVLGWNDRAVRHFDAYANSQVTDVPPTIDSPTQSEKENLARADKKWGTQMYSNGYICRNPNRNDQMHHYDMNLNYIDELLWHFEYDADTAYMRKMWPVLTRHLAWEKRNFDKDGNHLYDAYCCIWASDALYYNGGDVTHSSAYNYRGNLLAAKIARIIGEDPQPYQKEADAIEKAMNESLWIGQGQHAFHKEMPPHWAEYKDRMGLGRVHPDAALWSIYTPIDCGVGTPEQKYSCTQYVDRAIPHINVEMERPAFDSKALDSSVGNGTYQVISTSDWMPYSWSINNVASAEIMHTVLSFFEAGRADEGMRLMKGNILDQMYLGASPGNLGQISYYDAARGECYRDFGDNIGISARAIVQGLFGIVPNALDGKCVIRPGFPLIWDSVEVKLPYMEYKYKRVGETGVLSVTQHFTRPLQIIARINGAQGAYSDYAGDASETQTITFPIGSIEPAPAVQPCIGGNDDLQQFMVANEVIPNQEIKKIIPVPMPFNARVTDIFKEQYVSPRPMSTSLEIPIQGIGEWCHPKFTVEINDSVFRALTVNDMRTIAGIDYATPRTGQNILFASLWDNYPDDVSIPVKKVKADAASVLLAGSTNHMQIHIDNAVIYAEYIDGTRDSLLLVPPFNYGPIEQDYYIDGKAFRIAACPKGGQEGKSCCAGVMRPIRVSLSSDVASRQLGHEMGVPATEVYGRLLDGGAAQIVTMPLNPDKKLCDITLRCLSNDIVVGIMAVTLIQKKY